MAATAVFIGLLGLGFLAFTFTGSVSDLTGELDPLNSRLDVMEDEVQEYRLALAVQGAIGQRIDDVDLEALNLEGKLQSLNQEMDVLLAQISDITGYAAPSNVEIKRFGPSVDGYSVRQRREVLTCCCTRQLCGPRLTSKTPSLFKSLALEDQALGSPLQ